MAIARSLVALTRNRANATFAFSAAPMAIPLDTDQPNTALSSLLARADAIELTSATTSTTVTGVVVTTTGIKLQMDFYFTFGVATRLTGRFRVRIPWEVTFASGAGGVGRMNVNLVRLVNGSIGAIDGVTSVTGQLRSLAGLAVFVENNISIGLPTNTVIPSDAVLVLRVEFDVTTATALGNPNIRIFHDPLTAANRLSLEHDSIE